jgi:ribosomal protein L11 methyltransferase
MHCVRLKIMNYVEVVIEADLDSGDLLAMIESSETLGAWESNGSLHLYWPEEKWDAATLENLKSVLPRLGITEAASILKICLVPDQDWNAEWAASLKPIKVGRRVRIRQSWHRADAGFDGIELVIDPKRAFGTGHHATTRLVIEWLENHIRGGERVLDVGTGSGILAMVAIRLGASEALGIDNDAVALECAREYSEANGFGTELKLLAASFEDLGVDKFDVVMANLDIRTLPRFGVHLPRLLNAGGIVCLSGLQQQDVNEVSEVLAQADFYIDSSKESEEWVSLSCKLRE